MTVIFAAGILLGVNIYVLNAQRLAHNDLPMPFGRGMALVLSGSMEPELRVDDLIFLKKTDDLSKGDVVVFHDRGDLVVHRIIQMDGDNLVTKGDANDTADEPISRDAVEAKVTGSLPRMGGIVRFLKSPTGIILVIALAVALLELSFRTEKSKSDKSLDDLKAEIRKIRDAQTAAQARQEGERPRKEDDPKPEDDPEPSEPVRVVIEDGEPCGSKEENGFPKE